MFPTIPRLLLFLVPLLTATPVATAQESTCYFVNQDVAIDDVPCNTTTNDATTCCGKNDICLSNGLCYIEGNEDGEGPILSRGSCTDPYWSGFCSTAKPCERFNPDSGFRVVNAPGNRYCCGDVVRSDKVPIDCKVDGNFTLEPGKIIPGVAGLSGISSDNGGSSSSDKSTRLAIGLGLGIPLGLIAASALAWGGWERRQKAISAKEVQDLKALNASSSGMGTMSTGSGMVLGQYGYGFAQGQQAPLAELESSGRSPAELDSMGDKR